MVLCLCGWYGHLWEIQAVLQQWSCMVLFKLLEFVANTIQFSFCLVATDGQTRLKNSRLAVKPTRMIIFRLFRLVLI